MFYSCVHIFRFFNICSDITKHLNFFPPRGIQNYYLKICRPITWLEDTYTRFSRDIRLQVTTASVVKASETLTSRLGSHKSDPVTFWRQSYVHPRTWTKQLTTLHNGGIDSGGMIVPGSKSDVHPPSWKDLAIESCVVLACTHTFLVHLHLYP